MVGKYDSWAYMIMNFICLIAAHITGIMFLVLIQLIFVGLQAHAAYRYGKQIRA